MKLFLLLVSSAIFAVSTASFAGEPGTHGGGEGQKKPQVSPSYFCTQDGEALNCRRVLLDESVILEDGVDHLILKSADQKISQGIEGS